VRWFGYGNDGGSAGRARLEEGRETLGLELESEHGTRSADLPRTDLHVHSQRHRVSTGLETTNEFRLMGLSGERVLMIGEMTVTERTQRP
jgi:hypothetical protein